MKTKFAGLVGALALLVATSASAVSLQSYQVITSGSDFIVSDTFDNVANVNQTAYHGLSISSNSPLKTTFLLDDTNIDGGSVAYSLYEAVISGLNATLGTLVGSWTDVDTAGTPGGSNPFTYLLSTTTSYVLSVSTSNQSVQSVSTGVSAVPLPAAAWLFGSAVLGAGALRRKQKDQVVVA